MEKSPAQFIFEKSKTNARNHDHEHSISKSDIERLLTGQSERCYYSGLKFNYSAIKNNPLYPSLDRVDSRLGYVPGNIVLVAWFINRAKSDCSVTEFIELLDRLKAVTPSELAEARLAGLLVVRRPVASQEVEADRLDQPLVVEDPEEAA